MARLAGRSGTASGKDWARIHTIGLLLGVAASIVPGGPASAQQARLSFYEPGISPDGRQIAFVHGGDIWTVPASGGEARLLIAHEEEESRPLYSPDGRFLAFNSDRDGTPHIYVHDLQAGTTRQLTFMSAATLLDGWSADSEWIWFSSNSHDISGMADVFRVRVEGGTPMPVLADRYAGDYWAAPHADGRVAVSTRGRMAWGQWWRNGHSHMDEAEIWLADPRGEFPTYTRVSAGGKNAWPMWTPDGRLAFMSDRSGSENLWRVSASGGEAERLTDFEQGRVLWPSISSDGIIAFERDFRIWTHDLDSGRTEPVEIRAVGAVQGPRIEAENADSFSGFTVSPDGKKVVVVARGEIFAGAAEEGDAGPLTTRVTRTPAPESDVAWAHDSRHIVYTSARHGSSNLYLYDFGSSAERQLTSGAGLDQAPVWSPEDLRVAYVRDGAELRVLEVESGEDRVVATGLIGFGSARVFGAPAWSPDGRWIAYRASANGEFWNVHVVPADGSAEARPVSFLPNTFGGGLVWHPDGRSIYFTTNQRTEDARVIRVDLVPRVPEFREDALEDLFRVEEEPEGEARPGTPEADEDEAAEEAEPVRIEFDGIRRRYEVVPIPFSAGEIAISPDGDHLIVSGSAAGRQNLYALSLDPLDEDPDDVRPVTSGSGFKSQIQFAEDAERVWYIQSGRVRSIGLDGTRERSLSLEAEMEVDFDAEKDDVFLANWSALDQGFYDPDHHGVDWEGVREAYAPVVAGARNRQEMRRALLLMTGELNASHTGVFGSESPSTPQVGRLGVRFDRGAYEADGALVVSEVLDLGPAHVSGGIEVGDEIVSVGGTAIDGSANLNRLLRGTVGERVALGIRSGDTERVVHVSPVSVGAEKNLVYRDWVESRRAYVDRVSDGRLGYVHIPDMGGGTLQRLYLDLDQENRARDGIVVDVRNNNGGFVNNYALDIFTRRSFMTMQPRGGAAASSRHQLGQRAYTNPVILVTNQNTLSDGEDFTEGWRTLEIGEVVGEPTAGWIIYTSGMQLFDGTGIRMPFIGIRGADGQNMELAPRPVDVEIERPSGEWYTGRDTQLDTAVERLLARIDAGN